MAAIQIDDLRRHAIARTLFRPTTLAQAVRRLGFLQADPMRALARAQDLILMHRVRDYRAGELEQRYPRLRLEEDCVVNYGFVPRELLALLHPRQARRPWDAKTQAQAAELLAHVRAHGRAHPREVQQVFAHHGRTVGYWGGEQNASTQLLDGLHYRGQLRVLRREGGTRIYAPVDHAVQDDSPQARQARAEALLDLVLRLYAPLPLASLGYLTSLLRYGAPQLQAECRQAFKTVRERHPHLRLDGETWVWPEGENPRSARHRVEPERLRWFAPFDPLVWDRRRFEQLWGWTYKFEAYTPAAQRTMGHYALPMLWGDRMLGWANLSVQNGRLRHELGFVDSRPRTPAFRRALEQALHEMHGFLGLDPAR